jgi:hypothetical protein
MTDPAPPTWTLTRIPRKEMHSATTYIWRITDGKRHADVDGFGREEEAERFARWLLTVMNAAGGVLPVRPENRGIL